MAIKGGNIISQLVQLIYSSQPFGYDSTTLQTILNDARRCNTRDGISGALVCRHDIYVQLLEGSKRLFMLPTCELVVMIVMLELRSSLVGQLLSAFLGSGLCYMTQQYP